MTYRSICNRLLRYWGVTTLIPASNANVLNVQGLNEQDIPDAVSYIQGAVEEAFGLMPASMQQRRQGAALRAPTAVTMAVTQYSTACTVSGWASWMAGCTVRLAGDGLDNRFISSVELLRPFMGTTGTVNATVYADCIAIPATFSGVIEPVSLDTRPRLTVAGSLEEFDRWTYSGPRSPLDIPQTGYLLANKSIGEPIAVFADFEALGTAQPQLYLRFSPMPGKAYSVTYTGKLAPPTITEANIWDENSPDTDPNVSSFLPNPSSTLLAFALQRATAHPNFSASGEQVTEIARQYKEAIRLLSARPPIVARTRAVFAE